MTTIDPGTLVEIDGRPAIRFERRFAAPVDRVWRAVTEPDELRSWFPARVEGERRVGATLTFAFDGDSDGAPDTGPVVEWDPPRAWAFEWGGSTIRIALEPDGDGTRMVFTDRPFDPSLAALTGAGWHACLVALDAHVAGLPAPDGEVWREVHDDYLDRMGPPLATPGADGGLTWARWHFADADRLRALAADLGGEWAFEPAEVGTRYRATRHDVAGAEDAARWHARLVELDMLAASGAHVATDHRRWVEPYRRLLG